MIPCLIMFAILIVHVGANEVSTTSFIHLRGSNFLDNDYVRAKDRSSFVEDLLRSIQSAKDTEEVFSIAENIPAIRNSFDKALRIRSATLVDAEVAISAIIKFSYLQTDSSSSVDPDSDSDSDIEDNVFRVGEGRRLEQLTECIDLRLQELGTEQLTAYLTCLASMSHINDIHSIEEAILSVLKEFGARAELCVAGRSSLSASQIIDMVHAATVTRQLCGVDEEALVRSLLHILVGLVVSRPLEDPGQASTLLSACSAEQLTRLLYAMAVHRISEDMIISPSLAIISSQFDGLSCGDGITLLWSFSRLGIVDCVLVTRTVNCISRCLEEALRLDQSGVLSDQDCLHLSESIEYLFRKFTRDLISSSYFGGRNADDLLIITDTLSTLTDLSHLFMKTFLLRETSNGYALPVFTYISFLRALSPIPVQPLWQQTAVDAVSSMHTTLSSAVASRSLSVEESCALLEACAYGVSSDEMSVGNLMRRDGRWHRLVGRIAVRIGQAVSHNDEEEEEHSNILDRAAPPMEAVAAAMFALAKMGHGCPTLFRKVLRRIASSPQDLDEISAMGQCQLSISLSRQDDSDLLSNIADLLIEKTLSAILTVDSVDLQAASFIAVSKILRHSKFAVSYDPHSPRVVVLPGRWVSSASTVMLMELHAAAARLPLNILSDDALQAVRSELVQRDFTGNRERRRYSCSCVLSFRPVRWEDLLQLATLPSRGLSVGHCSECAIIAEKACDSMLQHCQGMKRHNLEALLDTARVFSYRRRHSPELVTIITEHLSGHHQNFSAISTPAIPPTATSSPESEIEIEPSPPPLSSLSSSSSTSLATVVEGDGDGEGDGRVDWERAFQEGLLEAHLDQQQLFSGDRGQSKIFSSGIKIGKRIFSSFQRWTNNR